MKKKITYIFLITLFLITTGCIIYGFIDRKYKTEIYVSMNENYSLRRYSENDYKNFMTILINNRKQEEYESFTSEEIEKKGLGESYYLCYPVSKITIINNYFVGYIAEEKTDYNNGESNNKECGGYFYIKKNYNESKINVSEKEIEEKFGKNIKYKNSEKFMSIYRGTDYIRDYINAGFGELFVSSLIVGIIIAFIAGINYRLILKDEEKGIGIRNSIPMIIISLILAILVLGIFWFGVSLT